MAYGYRVTSDEDPLVELAESTNESLRAAGVPGTTPVDMFPFREAPFHVVTLKLGLNVTSFSSPACTTTVTWPWLPKPSGER